MVPYNGITSKDIRKLRASVTRVHNIKNMDTQHEKWKDDLRGFTLSRSVCGLILPAVVAEASDDYNRPAECDVGDWTDIIEVAAGFDHTVGLKADGTAVAVGSNSFGQCDVEGWTDII